MLLQTISNNKLGVEKFQVVEYNVNAVKYVANCIVILHRGKICERRINSFFYIFTYDMFVILLHFFLFYMNFFQVQVFYNLEI